jgi:hypothetical protein
MLSLRKRFNNIDKRYVAVAALLLVAIVAMAIAIPATTSKNTPKKSTHNRDSDLKGKQPKKPTYTFVSSDVSCQDLPSYPGADSTINVCTGSLTVIDSEHKTQEFKIDSASHLYDSGVEQPITTLPSLKANSTKLYLSFQSSDKTKISNIVYF